MSSVKLALPACFSSRLPSSQFSCCRAASRVRRQRLSHKNADFLRDGFQVIRNKLFGSSAVASIHPVTTRRVLLTQSFLPDGPTGFQPPFSSSQNPLLRLSEAPFSDTSPFLGIAELFSWVPLHRLSHSACTLPPAEPARAPRRLHRHRTNTAQFSRSASLTCPRFAPKRQSAQSHGSLFLIEPCRWTIFERFLVRVPD